MRAGGERRGNSYDRKRRRAWLLDTFDPDLGEGVARCALRVGDRCHLVVDESTLTVDRIDPGGSYARDNIQPACKPCQFEQGALITSGRRHEWLGWFKEAEQLGIDWNGQLG